MFVIDLDWTDEGRKDLTFEQDLDMFRDDFPGTTFTVIQEHGPAGGWPVVRVTAPDEKLMRKVLKRYGYGSGQGIVDELWPLARELPD